MGGREQAHGCLDVGIDRRKDAQKGPTHWQAGAWLHREGAGAGCISVDCKSCVMGHFFCAMLCLACYLCCCRGIFTLISLVPVFSLRHSSRQKLGRTRESSWGAVRCNFFNQSAASVVHRHVSSVIWHQSCSHLMIGSCAGYTGSCCASGATLILLLGLTAWPIAAR